jgi:Tol biopolymer transport system component
MPRIADVLERESEAVDLERGDFERLLGRRDRKQRNRRIRAGAVGVIVALVTGMILARSLISDSIPADRPVEPRPVPAASGALVYALDGDIYVADPDGSNAVKIADGRPAEDCAFIGEYWAEGSMWSPDGRYLAYRYTDCSSTEFRWGGVVISDAEGNVLAKFPSMGWKIAWSPDSTRVAVWDGLFETIGVYGVDGARQTQLTMPRGSTGSGDRDPMWTLDGTSLVVDNVELPLDGGTPRRLPGDAETYSPAGDSPDGSHYAYVDHRSLMVARSDGSGSVTLLTVGRGTFLGAIGYSPQGNRILFSRIEDRGRGESSLWSIGVDGSDARLVVAGTTQGEWLSR